MRRVREHAPLAFDKLLAMRWEISRAFPYGATDGRTLFLNPDGVQRIDAQPDPTGLMAFLLYHEAMHALLHHAVRGQRMADRRTMNIAADYIINDLIHRTNERVRKARGFVPFPFIAGILHDPAVSADHALEALYQRMLKPEPADEQQPPQPPADPQDGEPQDGEPQDGGDQQDGAPEDGDQSGDDQQDGAPQDGDQSGDGDGDQSGDQSGGGAPEDGAPEDGGDQSGGGGGGGPATGDGDLSDWVGTGGDDLAKPSLDEGETAAEFEAAVEAANERAFLQDALNARAGIDGAGGSREVQRVRSRHVVDWAEHLRQFLTSARRDGWESPFNAPVYTATGVVAAGRKRRALRQVAVAIDTSCSVPQRLLAEMLAQVQGTLDNGTIDSVLLVAVDHRVRSAVEYQAGDQLPTALGGGGGTMFAPAFAVIEELAPACDAIVFLTDGDAFDWGEFSEPAVPVLWLDYGHALVKPYTFGEVVSFTSR